MMETMLLGLTFKDSNDKDEPFTIVGIKPYDNNGGLGTKNGKDYYYDSYKLITIDSLGNLREFGNVYVKKHCRFIPADNPNPYYQKESQ